MNKLQNILILKIEKQIQNRKLFSSHSMKSSLSCCNNKHNNLCNSQFDHLISVIKQRYISPYKIIYMINQQQADLFKLRNQNSGCCSSSSITIPKHQMTKTQIFLSQEINQCFKIKNLNLFLQQMSDKFNNIVKSGQKQNLNVDEQVQKFLVQKVMSQGINLKIYKNVVERIKRQNQSISNSAMLWATPNTWYAKYPNTPLNFLSQTTLYDLNNKYQGFAIEENFLADYKENLFKQLKLLQQDGNFEQLMWSTGQQNIRNDTKSMNFPQNYAFDGTEQGYTKGKLIFPNLKKSLLTLRSIPFQINQKMNVYCTISQNNSINFFKNQILYKINSFSNISSRYSTFSMIGEFQNVQIKITIKQKSEQTNKNKIFEKIIKFGDLIIIDNRMVQKIQIRGKCDKIFMFTSWIFTLSKKQ